MSKKKREPQARNVPNREAGTASDLRIMYVMAALIALATLIAYAPSLRNGFTNWDDDRYVTANPVIQDFSWDGLGRIFSIFFQGNYHPLTLVVYSLQYHAGQLDPWLYHLVNLCLHTANTLLVLWFIRLITRDYRVAMIVSLLFGIHPLHVESVAWISELKDVLYTFFFLCSLIGYLYYARKPRRWNLYYGSLALFILACLSKGMAVVLPPIILLLDVIVLKTPVLDKKNLIEKLPFFTISLIMGIIAVLAQESSGAIGNDAVFTLLDQALVACYGVIFYLWKMFVPLDLSAIYPYPVKIDNHLPVIFLIAPLLVAGIGALVYYSKRFTSKIIFGALFFIVCIFPVLQFVPVGTAIVADRYFYLSSIGLFYVVAEGAMYLYNGNKVSSMVRWIALPVIGAVAILMLISLSRQRCAVWSDSVTLFNDVLEKSPDVPAAYINLGKAYRDAGKYDEAILYNQQAIERIPNSTELYYNLGNAYSMKNDYSHALDAYRKVIEMDSSFTKAYYNMGVVLVTLGHPEQAAEPFRQAARRHHEGAKQWLRENNYNW